MRRVIAITLFVCMSAVVVLPLLFSDPDDQLPPCCRRDGKHHCAMMAMMMARNHPLSGTSFRAAIQPCPYWQCGPVSPLTLKHSRFVSVIAFDPAAVPFMSGLRVSHGHPLPFLCTWDKRGPPVSVA